MRHFCLIFFLAIIVQTFSENIKENRRLNVMLKFEELQKLAEKVSVLEKGTGQSLIDLYVKKVKEILELLKAEVSSPQDKKRFDDWKKKIENLIIEKNVDAKELVNNTENAMVSIVGEMQEKLKEETILTEEDPKLKEEERKVQEEAKLKELKLAEEVKLKEETKLQEDMKLKEETKLKEDDKAKLKDDTKLKEDETKVKEDETNVVST